MAKKSANGRRATNQSASRPKPTYINVGLSASDKDELAAYILNDEFPLSRLLDLVEMGFHLALKTDSYGGGFRASITDLHEDSPTFNYCLTGRGSTALNAWYALAYRHYVLLSEDWSSTVESEGVSDFG